MSFLVQSLEALPQRENLVGPCLFSTACKLVVSGCVAHGVKKSDSEYMALTHISNWLHSLPVPIDLADFQHVQSFSGRLCCLVKTQAVEVAVLDEHVSRLNLHEVHAGLFRLTAAEWGLESLDSPHAAGNGTDTADEHSKGAQGFEVVEGHLLALRHQQDKAAYQPNPAHTLPGPNIASANNDAEPGKNEAHFLDESIGFHSSHLALALALGDLLLSKQMEKLTDSLKARVVGFPALDLS